MKKYLTALSILAFVALPLVSLAVDFDPTGQINNVDLGQPAPDKIPGVVFIIINVVLGLLAVVAVSLIIYSGISYLFSGGESEKIKKAKNILISCIIGLVIILAAWGITIYVLNILNQATAVQYPT